jgi:serine/threonine protein kinase
LTRIESKAFHESLPQSILIPSAILFIASDAIDVASQIRFIDGDSCPNFDRWLQLKQSGIVIDFPRIERLAFYVRCFNDYIVNFSVFEERSIMWYSSEVGNEIYDRIKDEFFVFVKSVPHSENVSESEIEHEIEKLINLHHPCITAPIGFVVPIESGNREELKIVRLYLEGSSLLEVISVNPLWLTSTVKAKAIAGIVLGLRSPPSLGIIRGHLTPNNILFDSDHCIHIVDFTPMIMEFGSHDGEEVTQVGSLPGEGWTPKIDLQAFASIVFELLFGHSNFVSTMIESKLHRPSEPGYSFNVILEILKQNKFRIEDHVDSAGVSRFSSWIESAELPDN